MAGSLIFQLAIPWIHGPLQLSIVICRDNISAWDSFRLVVELWNGTGRHRHSDGQCTVQAQQPVEVDVGALLVLINALLLTSHTPPSPIVTCSQAQRHGHGHACNAVASLSERPEKGPNRNPGIIIIGFYPPRSSKKFSARVVTGDPSCLENYPTRPSLPLPMPLPGPNPSRSPEAATATATPHYITS